MPSPSFSSWRLAAPRPAGAASNNLVHRHGNCGSLRHLLPPSGLNQTEARRRGVVSRVATPAEGTAETVARQGFARSDLGNVPVVGSETAADTRRGIVAASPTTAGTGGTLPQKPPDGSTQQTEEAARLDLVSTASPAVEPAALFDDAFIPCWTPALVAYLPLGCTLAACRMALWAAGVLLDLPQFRHPGVISAYLRLLGVRVTWHGLHLIPRAKHVLVSNHTSPGDLMVLFQLPQRYNHLISTALPPATVAARNLPVQLLPAAPAVYERLAAASDDPTPTHLFPEGGLTNGAAMLQFARGFTRFSEGMPVVPVALRSRTALGSRTHTLTSSFLANFFWFSFSPWVHIEATALPPMRRAPGEPRGAFVRRVQGAIAAHLGIPISEISIQQKRAMMKAKQGQATASASQAKAP